MAPETMLWLRVLPRSALLRATTSLASVLTHLRSSFVNLIALFFMFFSFLGPPLAE